MENKKKVWKIEQLAHKTWTLSLVLAQEAARAGQHGKGYAVVAQEARVLADKLAEYTEKVLFDGGDDDMFRGIVDFAVMMKFLSVNAALEIMHVAEHHMDFNIPKSMSVYAEELRRVAVSLNELTDKNAWQKPFTMPELISPSGSETVDSFFYFSICGYPLIENFKNIYEVCYPRKSDIEGDVLFLRGYKIPIINCYSRLGLQNNSADTDRQTVMLVCSDRVNHAGSRYAIPIDDLDINAIFYSRTGLAVPAKEGHAFAEYARECWDVVGGQLVFADWGKLTLIGKETAC